MNALVVAECANHIQALRHIFWTIIVDGKHGLGEESVFDFKYVPDYHITTSRGSDVQAGIREAGVERRNLKALVVALACTGAISYCSIWLISRIL